MADNRLGRWITRNSPSREDMAKSRWTRPFALRTELWRFTRRSVPRGVAVGLLVGIFLMVPGLQIIGAALLSLPFRANIPIAAAMTFLSNPATTPLILTGSYFVGSWFGLGGTAALPGRGADIGDWVAWLFSDAAPALVSGLLIIAVVSALVGYAVTTVGWRLWQARKWKRRTLRTGTATAA
jgi:uncharacterized protein (DUF2062 family)